MSFQDLGRKADQGVNKLKGQANEAKDTFNGMDTKEKKWIKMVACVAGAIILLLALGFCARGCNKKATSNINTVGLPPVAEQPVQVPAYSQAPVYPSQQPVVINQQNSDPMAGVLAGVAIGTILSNGQRYNGHNGYGDSRYHGPPQYITQRVYVKEPRNVPPLQKASGVQPSNISASSTNNATGMGNNAVNASAVRPGTNTLPAGTVSPGASSSVSAAEQAKRDAINAKAYERARQQNLKNELKARQAARTAAKSTPTRRK